MSREKESVPCSWPIIDTEDGEKMIAYGRLWEPMNDIALELNCFRHGLSKEEGGLGKLRHLIKSHNLIWPELRKTYHDWTHDRFTALCEDHKVITLAGGSGSGKSIDMARYALLWWWALPEHRTVLVCSTTITALMKRIWAYITQYHYLSHGNMPGIISGGPPPKILFDRKDSKHGIFGVPLKEGNSDRTLADLIGIHPDEGLLVVVDEATDVTPAVVDAITNWDSGGSHFQMIAIGNSKSKLDPHGRLSEPKAGWASVNPDYDKRWVTHRGVCLYHDCYQSPAVKRPEDPDIRFLVTAEDIQQKARDLGPSDPKFWRFVRGFWPPEDATKTVLTLSMIERHKGRESAEWNGDWLMTVAGLDPAFTSEGDECILRFATVGPMTNGKIGIDFGGTKNIVALQLDSRSKEPINYQIVNLAKMECEARGVEPHHLAIDTWGWGAGAGDILEKHWSEDIHRVVAIGSPTNSHVDSDMAETAIELYDRRVTELWFAMREYVTAGHIRGLDEETSEEFCSRNYNWKGRKLCLETKKDYKRRMGKGDGPTGSPDRADAATLIIDLLRDIGFTPGNREFMGDEKKRWEENWEVQKGYRMGMEPEEYEASWGQDAVEMSNMFGEDLGDE